MHRDNDVSDHYASSFYDDYDVNHDSVSFHGIMCKHTLVSLIIFEKILEVTKKVALGALVTFEGPIKATNEQHAGEWVVVNGTWRRGRLPKAEKKKKERATRAKRCCDG